MRKLFWLVVSTAFVSTIITLGVEHFERNQRFVNPKDDDEII